MTARLANPTRLGGVLLAAGTLAGLTPRTPPADPATVNARLTEWHVELSAVTVPAGPVTFAVSNAGSIPHAFEIEGQGMEKETPVIQPGSAGTLTVTLKPGRYEVYCPVGEDSHKKLGMLTRITVVAATGGAAMPEMARPAPSGESVKAIRVSGGGPVIQILPGPFPFPDSAGPILREFGDEKEGLESQAQKGPYSNNVAPATGTFSFTAWDLGATRDSVDGTAEVTTRDGAEWKLVLDRVQTRDVPHHPRFGGVILGLYYHGNTGVHTPLVPTINSAVALWAFGHLTRNGVKVTDQAQVHVMLLSRTRREKDYALACWDCSKNPIEELQLQVLPGPGEPPFDAPGGFLFVNWEKSSGRAVRR